MENREFLSATVSHTYPLPDNPVVSISVDFPVRRITVQGEREEPSLFLPSFDRAREVFPRSGGPSEDDLDLKARRILELMGRASELREAAQAGHHDLAMLRETLRKAEETDSKIDSILESAAEVSTDVSAAASVVAESREKAAAESAAIALVRNEMKAVEDQVRESQARTKAMEADVEAFHEFMVAQRKSVAETANDARDTVEDFKKNTEAIVGENQRLQEEIRTQLTRATGGALFGAFEDRRTQITGAKKFWAGASIGSLLLQVTAIIWLAREAIDASAAGVAVYERPLFILKASVTLPLVALIWFCIRQYANERSREEIYAFKAALSLSLSPYLGLVEDLTEKEATGEHREFTIQTIGQIFESPSGLSTNRDMDEGFVTKDALELKYEGKQTYSSDCRSSGILSGKEEREERTGRGSRSTVAGQCPCLRHRNLNR